MSEIPLYRFDDPVRAIVIRRPATPAPWINYLSNGRLHAFVSQAGGGMAWWHSPTALRLTRYRQYNLPIDSPGFYLYVREPDGTFWSPSWRPAETPLDEFAAVHEPGCTTFRARRGDLSAEVSLFVAPDHDVLVWDVSLRSHSAQPAECDVFAYVELSQLGWEVEPNWGYYVQHQLKTWHDPDLGAVCYLFHHDRQKRRDIAPLTFFGSSRPATSFSGDRGKFTGDYRSERNPTAVERGRCGNEELRGGQPCAALHHRLSLSPGEGQRLQFFLGVAPKALYAYDEARAATARALDALREPGAVDAQRAKLRGWWQEHLEAWQCDVPDADVERQVNTWTPVNCVHTARYSRSINTWAPGIRGVGFRDTCQDMLAIVPRRPRWARRELLYLLSQQYADGHTVHTSYPHEDQLPEESPRSDDHLWPPLLAHAIVAETGEADLLRQSVPYLAADRLSADGEASVWEHLLAGVRFTEAHLGSHGIPLILGSDWNDLIGRFARRGRGESVFCGQQYLVALDRLAELAEALQDGPSREWLLDCRRRQEAALLACGWDGDWWRRGYDDDGRPIGASVCETGRIYLNPQSWAVQAGLGTRERQLAGMQAVAEHLDTGLGLKILAPGFKTWPEEPDPFSGYGAGTGENGAVFCHANTWAIIAEALLGNAERAWRYFTQMIPHVAATKVGIDRYRAEPYAWVSNIVGPESPFFGWANVEQVTGTAAWMDVAATQYLLGIRPVLDGLVVWPCIPPTWDAFRVRRRYRGGELEIAVSNPDHVSAGVREVRADGAAVEPPRIPAGMLAGGTHRVEVVLG